MHAILLRHFPQNVMAIAIMITTGLLCLPVVQVNSPIAPDEIIILLKKSQKDAKLTKTICLWRTGVGQAEEGTAKP